MCTIEDFKNTLSNFATGVVIISTNYQGKNYGFTANSFVSVSLNPKLVSFCLDKKARSYSIFSLSKNFAVNILSSEQKDVAHRFSSSCLDKFLDIDYVLGEYNVPLISNCTSFIECIKYNQYESGDHDIFVGEVKNTTINNKLPPLLYFNRSYREINEQNN